MTGCILSDEGIEKIESKIGKSVDGMFDDIADLIATVREYQLRLLDKMNVNEIMREALEQIVKMRGESTHYWTKENFVARDTLRKVNQK